jgi:hypothetical protein
MSTNRNTSASPGENRRVAAVGLHDSREERGQELCRCAFFALPWLSPCFLGFLDVIFVMRRGTVIGGVPRGVGDGRLWS